MQEKNANSFAGQQAMPVGLWKFFSCCRVNGLVTSALLWQRS